MGLIKECIEDKKTDINPIWIMRQAGRYLPEFRRIRKQHPDFIRLCLNKKIVPEITLQPLKRFNFDAAIIFSDILMLPYALGQEVKFTKGLGPLLGKLNFKRIKKIKKADFIEKLKPVYKSIKVVSNDKILKKKDLFGFIGAPWTVFLYMKNRKSPKEFKKNNYIFHNKNERELFRTIIDFLKIHIKEQVNNGASIIQIFDSWAGLLNNEKNKDDLLYKPTKELVKFTKRLGVPVVCFPRGIKDYKTYCKKINPDAINIDYQVDPKKILKQIHIPVQGGLDPKILFGDKYQIKKEAIKYLEIFRDHPYIFNLGHGILPKTKVESVKYLVNLVKDFK